MPKKEEVKIIRSLAEYIYYFETKLKEKYNDRNTRLYFRGENEEFSTPCQAQLVREKDAEDNIYYRTLRREPEQFAGLSNLDILSKMKHHGISTRLLDVTTNPLAALYFAVGESKDAGYVYVMIGNHKDNNILNYDDDRALILANVPKLNNHERLVLTEYCKRKQNQIISYGKNNGAINKEENRVIKKLLYECERERNGFISNHGVRGGDLLKLYFVKPRFTNPRLKAQDALFVLFGLEKESYNEPKTIIKIPNNYKDYVRSELFFMAGISNAKMLLGLDDLAKDNKVNHYNSLIREGIKRVSHRRWCRKTRHGKGMAFNTRKKVERRKFKCMNMFPQAN